MVDLTDACVCLFYLFSLIALFYKSLLICFCVMSSYYSCSFNLNLLLLCDAVLSLLLFIECLFENPVSDPSLTALCKF